MGLVWKKRCRRTRDQERIENPGDYCEADQECHCRSKLSHHELLVPEGSPPPVCTSKKHAPGRGLNEQPVKMWLPSIKKI